ncbi:hypothetical protein [Aliiruegeria lutimaris]|uniref:Outer membrane protein beta-barrel domain-containing protein n=1 Tax=Aliiruegeria lutimaris TaxID=571298 RepID=A0A1G8Q4G2_9RHOB|nr:hypothetical protein [Aliiruegeria lutimaris]SDI99518.1 hypothetical protein SAMN04488026_101035 [Aliiruegeria lutimaris]
MFRSFSFILAACLGALPTASDARELAYRGFGLELSYVDSASSQGGLAGFGSAEILVSHRLGLQGDLALEYLETEDEAQAAALLGLHPYLRLGHGLSFGAYLLGRGTSEPATATGLELAWKTQNGFTAEMYFGQTWGDELEQDGYVTSKGATLGYSFANDVCATLFFNKDTTSESGRRDRDYYDYGVGAEIPVGATGDTRLTASFGQVRFDAEGGPVTKVTLGLTRQLGGNQKRPTFTRRRSVLTELVGF